VSNCRSTALTIALLAAACGSPNGFEPEAVERLSAVRSLSGTPAPGFERALEPRSFAFPQDNGPHPDFQTEWWYFTGNLEGEDGRRFGYQLTIFRSALRPPDAADEGVSSAWHTAQVYMGHLGVTDARAGTFHSAEHFSRGAVGLAGARAEPHSVWLETWRVDGIQADTRRATPVPPLDLTAGGDDFGLELRLEPLRDPVFHGDSGLSRKGSEPGNASYYFSITRWSTVGTIRTPTGLFEVKGLSWMDREWSTSVLEEGQVGWDWFSLQLDDGRDLMFFRLRRADGSIDPVSSGTLVAADGSTRALQRDDVEVEVLERWTSPRTGGEYPVAWRLALDDGETTLDLAPLLEDQEHRHSFAYWEGAVEVSGTGRGAPLGGRGYVELTGYAGD
jgi:predicted secreted hydrolase